MDALNLNPNGRVWRENGRIKTWFENKLYEQLAHGYLKNGMPAHFDDFPQVVKYRIAMENSGEAPL